MMKDNGKDVSSPLMKNEGSKKSLPTSEEVREWIKKDLVAAHYFLGVLLQYPDIMRSCADQIRERILEKERGAGIDHVDTAEEAKGYAD